MDEPFQSWETALALNERGKLEDSESAFVKATNDFFYAGSNTTQAVARAYFEYSTLMDSFAIVQRAKQFRFQSKYEQSLSEFGKVSEILRGTVHFGFLSGYISACAILETAEELIDKPDRFEAYRNAIALFEQSKIALGLRDESHPSMPVIDSMIKYGVFMALSTESQILSEEGKTGEARRKSVRSERVRKEYLKLTGKPHTEKTMNYFPLSDWLRARRGGFIVSFAEKDSLCFGNVGLNPVFLETAGASMVRRVIKPHESFSVGVDKLGKGRIRIVYRDIVGKDDYDEGCMLII